MWVLYFYFILSNHLAPVSRQQQQLTKRKGRKHEWRSSAKWHTFGNDEAHGFQICWQHVRVILDNLRQLLAYEGFTLPVGAILSLATCMTLWPWIVVKGEGLEDQDEGLGETILPVCPEPLRVCLEMLKGVSTTLKGCTKQLQCITRLSKHAVWVDDREQQLV